MKRYLSLRQVLDLFGISKAEMYQKLQLRDDLPDDIFESLVFDESRIEALVQAEIDRQS